MRPSRSLALIVVAAFAICGWIGSSSGSFAFAAITERDHVLEVSLGDGHLDLVREHAVPAGTSGLAQPIDPDHVVHLCHSLDAASSRPQAAGSAAVDAGIAADPRTPFAATSHRAVSTFGFLDCDRRAPSTTVWRL